MKSYTTELTHEEWSRKRLEILKRDGFRCTHCGRSRSEEILSSDGKSLGFFGTEKDCLEVENVKEIRLYSPEEFRMRHGISKLSVCTLKYEPYRFLFNDADGRIILSMVQKTLSPEDSSIEFAEVIMESGESVFVEKLKHSSIRKLKSPIHFIYRSESPIALNIHHKVYRQDREVWDYPSKELTTLCETCHESLHQTTEVPRIKLTPCLRCGGLGHIPRFRHVENGICFRCHGDKYEEYIPRDKRQLADPETTDHYRRMVI